MNSTILFFDALSIRDCQDESNEPIGPVAIPIYGKRKTTDCAPQIESILISFVRNKVRFLEQSYAFEATASIRQREACFVEEMSVVTDSMIVHCFDTIISDLKHVDPPKPEYDTSLQ